MPYIDEVKKKIARSVELTLPNGSVIRVSPETAARVNGAVAYAKLWEREAPRLHRMYKEQEIKL